MRTPTTADRAEGPSLLGQTVVVVGGSSDIGLETARRTRAEGANVVLAARDPKRLRSAALEVGATSTAAFDADDANALARFFSENSPQRGWVPLPQSSLPGDGQRTRSGR